MKSFIVLALCVAVAVAIPVDPKDAVVTKYENSNIGVDGYQFSVETSDGKSHQEAAQLVNVGKENEGIAVQGAFRYTDPVSGQTFEVTYTADENGFQPQGAHLPRA